MGTDSTENRDRQDGQQTTDGQQPAAEDADRRADHPAAGETGRTVGQVGEEPLTCHICQRPAVLEVHTTGHTVHDIAACRMPSDDGVWVCRSCHEALHRWMETHSGQNLGLRAIAGVLNEALSVIKTPRHYRRQWSGPRASG